MLVLAMLLAACWGVLQLAVLGSLTRTVRLSTLLLAVALGVYGCGVLSIGVQFALTRGWALATDTPVFDVVRTASYTVDPFVEEVVKALPLAAAALWVRTRRQWGLTDFILVGAGVGAGFGLLEAILRFGDDADRALAVPGGWLLPINLAPPFIPAPWLSVVSWLPEPVSSSSLFEIGSEAGTNQHLVWSATAGLGMGVLARVRTPWRLVGLAPLALAGADHASYNYDVVSLTGTLVGDVLTAPFRWAQPVLGAWPLLALVLAVVLDIRRARHARAAHPEVLLRGESPSLADEWVTAGRYAVMRPPWPAVVVWRFVLTRRAALYAAASSGGRGAGTEALLSEVVHARHQLDAAWSAEAWRGVGLRRGVSAGGVPGESALRRYWPLGVWLLLLVPPLLYYGAGSTPLLSGVQGALAVPWLLPVLLMFLLAGLAWTVWQGAMAARALPVAVRQPAGEPAARTASRALTAAGATLLGLVVLAAAVRGTAPDAPVIRNLHVLDAVSNLLLAAGIALILAGLVFFPPFAAVAVAGGGIVLVPTLSAGLATSATLGVGAVLLSQAAEGAASGGRGGSGGQGAGSGRGADPVPDIPQQPPRPRPQVRHWKLRNIVDNLWHGSTKPTRVGNGTTMDAVRNEVRTGRPTQRTFHTEKAQRELRAVQRWLRQHGASATREDRLVARQLEAELRALVGGP